MITFLSVVSALSLISQRENVYINKNRDNKKCERNPDCFFVKREMINNDFNEEAEGKELEIKKFIKKYEFETISTIILPFKISINIDRLLDIIDYE